MSMQELTIAEPRQVKTSHKSAKRERIPKRIAEAIRLLESGQCKTQVAAASRVGMNATYLCEALKKPKIQAFIARKRAENIALGSLQASYRYPALVFAESEHVAEKASARLLEQSGDLKVASGGVNVNISNNIAAGYVMDLRPMSPAIEGQVVDVTLSPKGLDD